VCGFSYAARRCFSSVFILWSLVFSSWRVRQSGQVMLLFLADYEVDGSSEVFFGAGDVSSVSYGDCFFSDYVLDVCGED